MKKIESVIPENTCCDMRDSWNIISKLSNDFWVIIHWPSWCENEFFYSDDFLHSYSFSTNLTEFDITMWTGYEKLLSKIRYVLDNFSSIKVLFILWTCSSELIWDDIDNINNYFVTNVKIIIIHTSWMRWAWYHYTKYNVFKSLFKIFENKKNLNNVNKKVNIFFQDGMQNNFFRKEIKEFLLNFWIEVNSFLNSNITLEELKTINNVEYNYLIWRDNDFIVLLDYLKKDFNINYKILDLPVWLKNINKFYFTIISDFFITKKKYIIEFLKYQKKYLEKINKTILNKYFEQNSFKTNSSLFINLLNDIWLKNIIFWSIDYKDWVNSSHKFNFSNKIVINWNNEIFSTANLFWSKVFNTINRYMWFIWLEKFYIDIKDQYYYNSFINRYNKYF